jgi:hypothetical protein
MTGAIFRALHLMLMELFSGASFSKRGSFLKGSSGGDVKAHREGFVARSEKSPETELGLRDKCLSCHFVNDQPVQNYGKTEDQQYRKDSIRQEVTASRNALGSCHHAKQN